MNDGKHAGDGGPAEYAEGRVTEPLDPPNQRRPSEGASAPDIAEDDLKGFRFDASGMPLGPNDMPVPDVPSPLAARYLFPTEKYRGEWRRHWIHLMPVIVVGVLSTFVGGYITGVFGKGGNSTLVTGVIVVYLCILLWGAWRVFDWYFDRFILTNKRIMVINGIVTRKVAMMPLLRVTDMKYEQSPLGRLMNYGSFVMESAGQDQALRDVKHLPDPNELYLQICEEMYEPEAVDARDTVDESLDLDEPQTADNKLGGDA